MPPSPPWNSAAPSKMKAGGGTAGGAAVLATSAGLSKLSTSVPPSCASDGGGLSVREAWAVRNWPNVSSSNWEKVAQDGAGRDGGDDRQGGPNRRVRHALQNVDLEGPIEQGVRPGQQPRGRAVQLDAEGARQQGVGRRQQRIGASRQTRHGRGERNLLADARHRPAGIRAGGAGRSGRRVGAKAGHDREDGDRAGIRRRLQPRRSDGMGRGVDVTSGVRSVLVEPPWPDTKPSPASTPPPDRSRSALLPPGPTARRG